MEASGSGGERSSPQRSSLSPFPIHPEENLLQRFVNGLDNYISQPVHQPNENTDLDAPGEPDNPLTKSVVGVDFFDYIYQTTKTMTDAEESIVFVFTMIWVHIEHLTVELSFAYRVHVEVFRIHVDTRGPVIRLACPDERNFVKELFLACSSFSLIASATYST